MTIHIRPFTSLDTEFITTLIPRFSEFDLPTWRQRDEIDSTNSASLKQAMEAPEPDSAIFIAEDEEGKRAGFLHLQTQTDYFNGSKVAYISDIAVDSAFEGQGIGRILLDKAEDWAREQDCSLLTLYVFSNNLRARKVYEKLGFKEEITKCVKPLFQKEQ
jgi:ribosomal protein S18 acetylase RimI-like enzyme